MQSLMTTLQRFLYKDLSGKPDWQLPLYRAGQVVYASFRDLADGELSLRAMSLVYTTLITIVPLLAISFSVLKGFGVHNQIKPFLLNLLEGLGPEKGEEVADRVIGFVDNIEVGVLGAAGLAFLIYAVIALMQKIETAFNYLWRVGQDRSIAKRFSDYLSVLLMGPLLIFISAGITTTVRHSPLVQHLGNIHLLGPLFEFASIFVPWLVLSVGFTFFYLYIPNTKVRISAAFIGAMVAAALWKVIGFIFASFIAGSANYVAIYAAFATLIILMIWLYAIWMVLLIGANIAFYLQYPRYLSVRRESLVMTPRLITSIGLSALKLVAEQQYQDKRAPSMEELCKKLDVPIIAMQRILDILVDGGILAESSEDPRRYYPAVPFDTTPLEDALEVLETVGHEGYIKADYKRQPADIESLVDKLIAARKKAVSKRPIADILLS